MGQMIMAMSQFSQETQRQMIAMASQLRQFVDAPALPARVAAQYILERVHKPMPVMPAMSYGSC